MAVHKKMNEKQNDKRFVYWSLVVASIFLIIILIVMWLGFGEFTNSKGQIIQPSFGIKLIITFVFLAFIALGFLLFKLQSKNQDRQKKFK